VSDPVRLLFDENLAPRLLRLLADVFPSSVHVREVGLASASDQIVWQYAADHGLVIATKDEDFRQRSYVLGAPPKVVWLRLGNCTTADIEVVLRRAASEIEAFANEEGPALLVVGRG
jgi:predicted nuclease of predicted toxin-antitoxin system